MLGGTISRAILPEQRIGSAISSGSGSTTPVDMSAASYSSSSTVFRKARASSVSCPLIPSGMMTDSFLPVLSSTCLAMALLDPSGTSATHMGQTFPFFSSMRQCCTTKRGKSTSPASP